MQQQTIANQAAIHKQEDRIPVHLLHLRAGDEAAQCEDARGPVVGINYFELALYVVQIDQIFECLVAEYLIDALLQRFHRRDVQQLRGAMTELERFLGMRQAVVRGKRSDVRQLGLIGPQKLLARRNVIEQIADRDSCSRRPGKLVASQDLAARDFNRRSRGLLGRARFEQQPRHRSDGRQSFAPESERRDGEQIFDVAQFAGSVALEGQQRIVAQHAAAVIGDADQAAAAALDIDPQIGGPGVEGVFEEFFDYRCGPLNHLSGRDFVSDVVGEDADSAHALFRSLTVAARFSQLCAH